jgi:hypothetical protein
MEEIVQLTYNSHKDAERVAKALFKALSRPMDSEATQLEGLIALSILECCVGEGPKFFVDHVNYKPYLAALEHLLKGKNEMLSHPLIVENGGIAPMPTLQSETGRIHALIITEVKSREQRYRQWLKDNPGSRKQHPNTTNDPKKHQGKLTAEGSFYDRTTHWPNRDFSHLSSSTEEKRRRPYPPQQSYPPQAPPSTVSDAESASFYYGDTNTAQASQPPMQTPQQQQPQPHNPSRRHESDHTSLEALENTVHTTERRWPYRRLEPDRTSLEELNNTELGGKVGDVFKKRSVAEVLVREGMLIMSRS